MPAAVAAAARQPQAEQRVRVDSSQVHQVHSHQQVGRIAREDLHMAAAESESET